MSVSNSKKNLPVVELKDVNKIEGKANHNSKFRKNDKLEKSERLERSVVEKNKNFKKSSEINKKKFKEKDTDKNKVLQEKKIIKPVKKNSATLADIRDIIPKLSSGTSKKQKSSRKKPTNGHTSSEDNLSDSMISEGVKIKIPQRSFQVNKPKDEEEMNYKIMTENTCGYVSSDSNSSFSSKCDQESIFDFKRDLLESGDIVENLNMRGGTRKLFAPKTKSKSLLNVNNRLKNNFLNLLDTKENFEKDKLDIDKQLQDSGEESEVSISKVN
jgi:hypothetical protein